MKKFDVFEFWCGLIFNYLKHTPAQVYVLIPPRNSAKQKPKEVQSAAKPLAERSEANEVPSEARLKGNVFYTMSLRGPVITLTKTGPKAEFDGTGWTGGTGWTVIKSVL